MSKPRWLLTAAFSAFVVGASLSFLARNLVANWSELLTYDFSFNVWYLAAGFLCLASAVLLFGLVWGRILHALDPLVPAQGWAALRIHAIGWVARYIPGKVPFFATRIVLGRRIGYSNFTLAMSTAYEQVLYIAISFLLSGLLLIPYLAIVPAPLRVYFLLLPVMLGAIIVVQPRMLVAIMNLRSRLTGAARIGHDTVLNLRSTALFVMLYGMVLSLMGLGFYFVASSLTPFPIANIPAFMGISILAGAIGMVTVPVPAGIGVRESATVLLLTSFVSLEVATTIALLARAIATLADLAFVGVVTGVFGGRKFATRYHYG